jgi:hypothetical protein
VKPHPVRIGLVIGFLVVPVYAVIDALDITGWPRVACLGLGSAGIAIVVLIIASGLGRRSPTDDPDVFS